MKKIVIVLSVLSLLFVNCANSITDPKNHNKIVESYGLLNEETRIDYVKYDICWGNAIWGFLLIETVIAPIYFWGFSLKEPIGSKDDVKNGSY